jgi:hypothetical protein
MYCAKEILCIGDVPCVAQEEQGFGPSTLSTYPLPIYLRYWGLSLPPTWDQGGRDPNTPEEGFQVINKPCVRKTRYVCLISWTLRSGSEQGPSPEVT